MSDVLPIKLQVTGDTKAVAAVRKEIEQLAAASQKAGGQASSASAKQAQAYQKLATETQKTALAQNNAAVSAQKLATETNRTATAAAQATAAHTRAETSALRLAQAHQKAAQPAQSLTSLFGQLSGQLSGMGGTMGSLAGSIGNLAGSLGTLGAVGAAVGIGAMAVELGVAGANADLMRQRFDGLAASAGTTGAALLGALRAASGGEISDLNLQLAANKAQLLGVADSAEEFGVLMGIARDRAQQMGISTTQAFNDLVTGLGRGSALILDNLGIIVSVEEANKQYAASLGKTADALTDAESKQALINQVLAQGKASLDATGGAVESSAGTFARFSANIANATSALGTGIATGLEPYVASINDGVTATGSLVDWIAQIGSTTPEATAATAAYAAEMERSGNVTLANAAYDAALVAARQQIAPATAQATAAQVAFTATGPAAAAMQGQIGAATAIATAAFQAQASEQAALAAVTMTSVQAGMADAAAKQEVAAKTQLLTAETNAAVSAFMLLHPNISASGVAAMAAAGSINPLLVQLIQATLRAREAAQALAAFNILSGVKAAGGNLGAASVDDANNDKRAFRAAQQAERNKIALAQTTAERERTLAIGTTDAKIALYQKDYNAAVKLHGAESTQAYEAQTALLKAQQTGGAARTSASGAAATKLEGIETKTGDKLSQIVQDTQAKLIEIDRKAADERAKIAADLANKIATSAADRRASNEADDLDLIGVTDEKEAQKLNDRERAQAAAREREVAAAKEAQDAIANGEAESASKVYDIREKQIGDQQALDEKYAERQRELAGNDEALDALKTQYDEGTRANEEAANTRIAIAKAESAQKAAEVQAEKDAVIAAANEQANQVVSAAERSAAGVTKATGAARTASVANLKAIGDAVTAIPASKTITISVNQQGTVGAASSGGSGNKAAGGGTFVTTGQTTLTVGDNPGGRELVTVTPLSGSGQTSISGGMIKLAGGGTVDAGGGYTTPIAGGSAPASGGSSGRARSGAAAPVDAKKALDEMKNTIQLLMDMARLKEQIAELAGVPAFDIPVVQALVQRAQEFTAYVASHLVPITKAEGESLGRYLDAAKNAASLLGDMSSLKQDIAELKNVPAFDQAMVLALIDRAKQFTSAVQSQLIPLTEFERDQIGRYTQAVGDVVSMLTDVADLKKELAAPAPPLDTNYIWQLVADAAAVTVIMRDKLIGTTEAQADAAGLYASVVGDTVAILNDVLDLGQSLKENGVGAISDAMVIQLADQAARITTLVSGRLIPATEAQNDATSAYADLVGSSVSVLKDVANLSGNLFTDYTSPTDAQIALLATDARRIAQGFFDAGAIMGKEGAEAGKAYAEGVGAAFSAAKDGLLVIDALKSGDFVLPDNALKQFQSSSLDILTTMEALGARAALIPTSDIAALQNVTSAISGQAEALIRLASVPFGDLGGASAGLRGSGGAVGATTITNYNTFQLPQGTPQQIATEAMRLLNQQMGTRR